LANNGYEPPAPTSLNATWFHQSMWQRKEAAVAIDRLSLLET